jgi:[CysO sulfur-carrier protein]-S-L-cysteine hydrolase
MISVTEQGLTMPEEALHAMAAHAYRCFPEEMCGLIVGTFDHADSARVLRFIPVTNIAASAKVYTINPQEHLQIELAAEKEGLEVVGVVHSHTHSEPYPSPTDVAQAPDPGWHYVIVGLKRGAPEVRSYRIVDGVISEESVTIS